MIMEAVLLLIAILILLVVTYSCLCPDGTEMFAISPNIVGSGDFHIQQPGAIADSGSFTNDMADYINGE